MNYEQITTVTHYFIVILVFKTLLLLSQSPIFRLVKLMFWIAKALSFDTHVSCSTKTIPEI